MTGSGGRVPAHLRVSSVPVKQIVPDPIAIVTRPVHRAFFGTSKKALCTDGHMGSKREGAIGRRSFAGEDAFAAPPSSNALVPASFGAASCMEPFGIEPSKSARPP